MDFGTKGLDFVAYHARTNPARVACVDLRRGDRLDYRGLDQRIAQCCGWLAGVISPGARVAMLARNSTDLLVLHFACLRLGAVFQPLNWRLTGPELQALIEDGAPEILVFEQEFEAAALEAVADGSQHLVRIAEGDDQLGAAIRAARPLYPAPVDPDAPATLLYTSGTTGRSKAVIITQRSAWVTAFNFSITNEVAPRDTLLCDMPLFHVAGLFGVARATLLMGGTLLISDRFEPGFALARLSDPDLAISHYFAVPQMAATMLGHPDFATANLRGLKALVVGGAPLSADLVEAYRVAGVKMINGYGLSEAGTVLGMPLDFDIVARKGGSSGVPSMLIEVRLVGADGKDVGVGEVGEIWLKGPSVTPGYWDQPEVTAKTFSSDGWLKTGDAARCDPEGFYTVVDRWKDMYISGGENVYPAEVEAVLLSLPGVVEASVVGVPDPKWGEVGCGFLVVAGAVDEALILSACRSRLAGYKVPKYLRPVASLPRTASGKVRKDELRQAFKR